MQNVKPGYPISVRCPHLQLNDNDAVHGIKKEGAFIEKEYNAHRKSAVSTNNHQTGKDSRQIYDRIFKRIFSLSNTSVIHLINGLFDRHFPPDSSVEYPNREFVMPSLQNRLADVILIIDNVHVFHLEA